MAEAEFEPKPSMVLATLPCGLPGRSNEGTEECPGHRVLGRLEWSVFM